MQADGAAGDTVRIHVLGGVRATCGESEIALGGPRARALVAALVSARGRTLSADSLLRDVWGRSTPGRRSALRANVSRLRSTALAPYLTGGRQGYALTPGPRLWVDLWRAADLAEASARPSRQDLVELAAVVEALPLDGIAGSPFLDEARARAHSLVRQALVRAIDAHRGDARALAAVQQLLARDPDDLELRALQIAAAAGDPAAGGASRAAFTTRRVGVPTPIAPSLARPEDEARLVAALRLSRLVTLVGPAGVGKSRVAIEWARGGASSSQEHVWFCAVGGRRSRSADLSGGGTRQGWLHDVAAVIGADEATLDGVSERLAPLQGTLVLDGMDGLDRAHDHREEAAGSIADLARLLESAPAVRAVVTSRRPLGVPGESVHRIGPLGRTDGRALLLLRSGLAAPAGTRDGLATTSHEHDELDDLVSALGGLPLAIELAAARLAQTPVGSVIDAVSGGDGYDVLDRALAATSALLTAGQHATLTRLCVFRGAFTSDSAGALGGPSSAADIEVLTGWALLTHETHAGEDAWRVPEIVRRHLDVAGRHHDALRAEHMRWFAARTLPAFDELTTADAPRAWQRLALERADIDAAFERAVARDDRACALGIAAGMAWAGLTSGTQAATLALGRRAASVPGSAPPAVEARASLGRGILAYQLASMREAAQSLDDALRFSVLADDRELIALSHAYRAYFATLAPDTLGEAIAGIRAARAGLPDLPENTRAMVALITAQVERARGDHARALAATETARELAERSGHSWVRVMSRVVEAKVRLDARDPVGALAAVRVVVDDPSALADPISVLIAAGVAAGAAAAAGKDAAGARIVGAVDALGSRIGFDPRANEPADFERYRRRVRQALTPEAWRDAYDHGTRFTLVELVDETVRL